jgi:hypothetical protein
VLQANQGAIHPRGYALRTMTALLESAKKQVNV